MDESRFTLFPPDGRRVYGRRGERFADASVDERDRFEGGSVMVWGGIALATKSQLIILEGTVTAVRYRDEILRPVAVPPCRTSAGVTERQCPATCSHSLSEFSGKQ